MTSPTPRHAVQLPPILDLKSAAPVRDALLEQRGRAIVLDASGVQRLGGLCLQVLLAARQTWRADGHAFRIADPSPEFASSVVLFGAGTLMNEPE